MKSPPIFPLLAITIILIAVGVHFFPSQPSPVEPHELDLLNGANLVLQINQLRKDKGLPALVEKQGIADEARDLTNFSTPTGIVTASGQITARFAHLDGDYYSTQRLLGEWLKERGKSAVLYGYGTTIGAWVTYTVEGNPGDKPVAYVAVIIR